MQKTLENILQSEIDPAFAKRARLIFEEVERIKPKKILDAGCGRGFYVASLSYFSFIREIHGFDVNEKYLKLARRNCTNPGSKIQRASIYKLPYSNKYFDFIICSEVLEHLKDDKKALFELKRVLKPNGTLVITVPNYNFPILWDPLNWILMRLFNIHIDKNIWWLAGIWADHERLYTKNEINQLVKSAGFKIEKSQGVIRWCWPFSHFLLYGIGKNLVERLGLSLGNRFNQDTDKKISKMISSLMTLPSRSFDNQNETVSMNIILFAQ